MAGIKNLDRLLHSMKPELLKDEFVFCTIPEKKARELKINPKMVFREKEGTTLVMEKKSAGKLKIPYKGVWAMITLTVHSNLAAVGFLAAITKKLAENRISVNAVSAYYHDHLFIQKKHAKKAMKLLKELSQQKKPQKPNI